VSLSRQRSIVNGRPIANNGNDGLRACAKIILNPLIIYSFLRISRAIYRKDIRHKWFSWKYDSITDIINPDVTGMNTP
jgi:hypothetical protein